MEFAVNGGDSFDYLYDIETPVSRPQRDQKREFAAFPQLHAIQIMNNSPWNYDAEELKTNTFPHSPNRLPLHQPASSPQEVVTVQGRCFSCCKEPEVTCSAFCCSIIFIAGACMWGLCNDSTISACNGVKVTGQVIVGFGLFVVFYIAVSACCASTCCRPPRD